MATEFEIALALKDSRLISITEPAVMRAHQALAYLIWDQQRLGQSTTKEEIRLVDGAERTHSSTISANPNCSIHLLELLAKDKDYDVRRSVAENPSCPEKLRISLLEHLAKDEDRWIRRRVALNPSCPVTLLELLAKDEDSRVRNSVALNPSCPEKLRISLLEPLAKDEESGVRRSVAENPSCPVHLLELLAKDKDSGVRWRVAENPSCPVTLLELLAKDEDSRVRNSVALNPSCPEKLRISLLEHLAKDEDRWIRHRVAENPSCPVHLLELLAKDEDRWNRKSIAEYVHTPVRILEYLYTEPKVNDYDEKKIKSVLQSPEQLSKLRADYLKKLCAGLNPSFSRVYGLLLSDCSPAVLTKCAKSTLWLERCAVAQNPLTSTKLLQVLAKDSNALVAAAAQRA